ncbi:F-box domain-containing protein [Colletotrichum graminicola]|uniref:F-box domain-containing protein n=1 Tax=Colletotrichum graminicola (strain M1.001 / M2 / FGSC 10212) TaxID=645133 RepID=E3QYU6_COLGM|nr:F-box domain-containing protein [Colletotrichum graminicola M1.001]EFQ36034.1 F-box domain-containing protein [Colletotrichum graminicola M1.001]WDK14722.1 F-box domain-containing protein [Colletotrichum graminicola]
MKSVKGDPESLVQGLQSIRIGQEAPDNETTGEDHGVVPVENPKGPEATPVGYDTIMTVINSDGTTSYYTNTGELITDEPPRPSEAIKAAVTDSDRVTSQGSLNVRSKKAERMKRKLQKKTAKTPRRQPTHLLHLPNEILVAILMHMLPSDIHKVGQTCHTLRHLVKHNEALLSRHIVSTRYPVLGRCFRLPVSLNEIDPKLHAVLQYDTRIEMLGIHRRYRHIPQPDPFKACTCLTCVLRWQALFTIVDFNHWQPDLAAGNPIPVIPRGEEPEWNEKLKEKTACTVLRALDSPLVYACLLEMHLRNTCASIKRQTDNKGNQRRHFIMLKEEAESGTDHFLEREGPTTADMPFQRDGYDLLEAYLPGRTWLKNEKRWAYMPADIHDRDLAWAATRWSPVTDDIATSLRPTPSRPTPV